jgi:hypothetical protein
MGWSQNPARQRPEQHDAPDVQAVAMGVHTGGGVPPPPPASGAGCGVGAGASQCPLVQLEEQQSAPDAHVPLVATHGVTHVLLAASQCFEQQSASAVHDAFWPRHAPGGRPQRPS